MHASQSKCIQLIPAHSPWAVQARMQACRAACLWACSRTDPWDWPTRQLAGSMLEQAMADFSLVVVHRLWEGSSGSTICLGSRSIAVVSVAVRVVNVGPVSISGRGMAVVEGLATHPPLGTLPAHATDAASHAWSSWRKDCECSKKALRALCCRP